MTEQNGQFTFAHFVEEDTLAARVKELDNRYSEEQVAATAFYLGFLSIAGMGSVVGLYGDSHYILHLMANIFAGDWLVEPISFGVVDPEKAYDFVLKEHSQLLAGRPDGMEDIKSEKPDDLPAMDKDTFKRLWGQA